MPKSKRNQQFHLNKTLKKDKKSKINLIEKIKENLNTKDEKKIIFLLKIENFKNNFFNEIRSEFKTDLFCFGTNS